MIMWTMCLSGSNRSSFQAAFPEMPIKSVITRATIAAHAECVQRGMGQTTLFSGRVSRNAAEDDR